MNIHTADWKSTEPIILISNILSVIFLVLICTLPLLLLVFFCVNKDQWSFDNFKTRYGSLLDGTNLEVEGNRRWTLMINPMSFFGRRLLFAIDVLLLGHSLWG